MHARRAEERFLSLTQYPLEEPDRNSTKLLLLTDLTQAHQLLVQEKEHLLEKSTIDPLTGLLNRQYFMEKYGGLSEQLPRRKSLLFIDVDDFKAINDQYGHLVGDDVLRELAACMKSTIRSANEAIRFGGGRVCRNFAGRRRGGSLPRRGAGAQLRRCDGIFRRRKGGFI